MMSPKMYRCFGEALESRGIILINNPKEYHVFVYVRRIFVIDNYWTERAEIKMNFKQWDQERYKEYLRDVEIPSELG